MDDSDECPLRLRLCTWNVGNAAPDPLDLANWLLGIPVDGDDVGPTDTDPKLPHILVVGAQETYVFPNQQHDEEDPQPVDTLATIMTDHERPGSAANDGVANQGLTPARGKLYAGIKAKLAKVAKGGGTIRRDGNVPTPAHALADKQANSPNEEVVEPNSVENRTITDTIDTSDPADKPTDETSGESRGDPITDSVPNPDRDAGSAIDRGSKSALDPPIDSAGSPAIPLSMNRTNCYGQSVVNHSSSDGLVDSTDTEVDNPIAEPGATHPPTDTASWTTDIPGTPSCGTMLDFASIDLESPMLPKPKDHALTSPGTPVTPVTPMNLLSGTFDLGRPLTPRGDCRRDAKERPTPLPLLFGGRHTRSGRMNASAFFSDPSKPASTKLADNESNICSLETATDSEKNDAPTPRKHELTKPASSRRTPSRASHLSIDTDLTHVAMKAKTNLQRKAAEGAVSISSMRQRGGAAVERRNSQRSSKETDSANPWDSAIARAVNDRLEPVRIHYLGQMRLAVYATKEVSRKIQLCQSDSVATGVGNVVANKGAISISFWLDKRYFCFISAHLAAHQGQKYFLERNRSVLSIFRGLQGTERIPLHVKYDHVFFMGDLNYRLRGSSPEIKDTSHRDHHWGETVRAVKEGRALELLRQDELGEQARLFTPLARFDEGPISFNPTFKVLRNDKEEYNPERVPAYCDRILWFSSNSTDCVQARRYCSIPSAPTSDHKPVYGEFTVGHGDRGAGKMVGVDIDTAPVVAVIIQSAFLRIPPKAALSSRRRLVLQVSESPSLDHQKSQRTVFNAEQNGQGIKMDASQFRVMSIPVSAMEYGRILFVLYEDTSASPRSYGQSVAVAELLAAKQAGFPAATSRLILESDGSAVGLERQQITLEITLSLLT